jgi:hypothetical protein
MFRYPKFLVIENSLTLYFFFRLTTHFCIISIVRTTEQKTILFFFYNKKNPHTPWSCWIKDLRCYWQLRYSWWFICWHIQSFLSSTLFLNLYYSYWNVWIPKVLSMDSQFSFYFVLWLNFFSIVSSVRAIILLLWLLFTFYLLFTFLLFFVTLFYFI